MGKYIGSPGPSEGTGNIQVKQRDRTSLEIKIRYLLKRARKARNRYTVRFFFFLPHSFNINSESYSVDRFYNSLKLYMRFDTPDFAVEELLDRGSGSSPLVRLENMVSRSQTEGTAVPESDFVYENKLLGAIYKSLLRDSFVPLLREDAAAGGDGNLRKRVVETAEQTVERLRAVAERYHGLRGKADKVFEKRKGILEECRLMDEHLSLLLERYLTSLLKTWDRKAPKGTLDGILEIIASEARYRQKAGYPTVLHADSDKRQRQDYIYREKILKRYSSSVLFFDVRKSSKGRKTEHLLYALAAGVAMIFATGVVFLTQPFLGNFTTSLFIILVVSYMAKDRIKDLFRDLFTRIWGVRLFDSKIKLYDSRHRKKLAVLKERCRFIERKHLEDELGPDVNREAVEFLDAGLGTVQILSYVKRIGIKTRTLRNIHNRITGLADIGIVDFQDLLRYLARKTSSVPVFNGKKTVEIVPVRRIYHLPVLIQVEEDDRRQNLGMQLIVDPKGIKSIEEGISPAIQPGSGP